MSGFDDEPEFFVLDYITITRDPRTKLVVAVGGNERASGILQTKGEFLPVHGPRGDYHRQPADLPVENQRQGATAAAHALLLAGASVHLDPELNTLLTPDGDRDAVHRYLGQLADRASRATCDREVAAVLTEIVAPDVGLLPRLTAVLVDTGFDWYQSKDAAGEDPALAALLVTAAADLRRSSQQFGHIRNQAAAPPPLPARPAPPPPPGPATSPRR
ncbi:hypothetical protein ABZ714_11350 [Streptomyces sp. NPDC006798]|uniref:hypothetical protein n=1 Tax=Streptomyces sp. NPDC006798 TaxID=3155462 RepID=UPI003404B91A